MSYRQKPWTLAPKPSLPADELLLGQFAGLFSRVSVTNRRIVITRPGRDLDLPYAEIADVRGGLLVYDEDTAFGRGLTIRTRAGERHTVEMWLGSKRAADFILDRLAAVAYPGFPEEYPDPLSAEKEPRVHPLDMIQDPPKGDDVGPDSQGNRGSD